MRELTSLQNMSTLSQHNRQIVGASSAMTRSLLDPIDENSLHEHSVPATVPSKSTLLMNKVSAHHPAQDYLANEDIHDDFQIPVNEIGWKGTIGPRFNGIDPYAAKNAQFQKGNAQNIG